MENETMTDQEINRTIAEACPSIHLSFYQPGCSGNYCGDLNAMHEVEMFAFGNDAREWERYRSEIDGWTCNEPYAVGATARQRAEAFLRTIGKWS